MDKINPEDFFYDLPEENIAKFPLENRDDSKLLIYENENILHEHFRSIPNYLPEGSTLFFNETRVIPARLIFQKTTGSYVEVFLLDPVSPSRIMQESMKSRSPVSWHCMIGNLKKWKNEEDLVMLLDERGFDTELRAKLTDRNSVIVEFHWNNSNLSFSEIITASGNIPLPPYIKRDLTNQDRERYQTVYSKIEGAVAAPTAGLHFTPEVILKMKDLGIKTSNLTLHVSAGTFQPIKVRDAMDHPMHSEQILVNRGNLEAILQSKKTIAVGTTSLRTLESLYWYGTALMKDEKAEFYVKKLQPYKKYNKNVSLNDAIEAILKKMQNEGKNQLVGDTEIFIFPGYEFKVCDGLITNYHLPGSTLILLVAAFIGKDWRNIYNEALMNNYRFLSYGDSSLLLK